MATTQPPEATGGTEQKLDPNPFAIAPPAKGRSREWGIWPSLITAVLLIGFFAPAYLHHMKLSADPKWFNDDARQQIWPLMKYHDGRLFKNDYVGDYYLACFPILYHKAYHLVGPFWKATSASKVIPYVLLAIVVWCVGQSARRLRGPAAGWAAIALCLGAQVYLNRISGALPRSFAFPILAVACFALARGKPMLLAIVTVIGAGFYPSAAIVSGVALAGWMLLPGKWLGKADEWQWWRRLAVLGGTAVLSVVVILPTRASSAEFGALLKASDATEYPEITSKGRYQERDGIDQQVSARALKDFLDAPLAGIGGKWEPWGNGTVLEARSIYLMILALLGLTGYALLLKNSPPGRRVLLIPIAGLLVYVAAIALYPTLFIPARYQLYPLALAMVVMVPAGLAHLATTIVKHTDQRRTQTIFVLAAVGPFILFGTAWNFFGKDRGLSSLKQAGLMRIPPARETLYTKLAALKAQTALVAGWPTEMNDVPYFCERSVLITYEGHQAIHREFADNMRQRMYLLIDALYSTDPTQLITLVKWQRVTHVVINRKYLYDSEGPPKYFAPFDKAIDERWKFLKEQRTNNPSVLPAILLEKKDVTVYYEDADWIILNVSRLKAEKTMK